MRISDWSSDVCSSDLDRLQRCVGILKIAAHGKGNFRLGLGVNDPRRIEHASVRNFHVREQRAEIWLIDTELPADRISRQADLPADQQIGRATGRERVCQYV